MSARHLSEVSGNGAGDGCPPKGVSNPLFLTMSRTSLVASGIACGEGFSITLPLPTSANRIWRRGAGGKTTHISREYAEWKREARHLVEGAGIEPLSGRYELLLLIPEKDRADADNRIKAISDLLVSCSVIPDDRHAWAVSVRRDAKVHARLCRVIVSPHQAALRGGSVAGGTLDGAFSVESVNAAA